MTVAAIVIAALALIIAGWEAVLLTSVRRRVAAVPEDGGVFEAIRRFDNDLGRIEHTLQDLAPRVHSVERKLPLAISHCGVVAYDAFDNIAGNLSRSIALLNDLGDGVVISVMVGRSESLFFTKQVRGSRGVEALSPEEDDAIAVAMSR